IKAASIDTGIEARDKHLRNADFFEVEKYPEITFQSSRVERRGSGGDDGFVAHGTLTMHGVSKEVALPFNATGAFKNPQSGVTERGFTAKLTLNRKDFGISFSRPAAPNFIGDAIEIELNILTRVPQKQG
ncbi:MAG: YceI family protein, partial [Pyrinomonadaceae bacterium]